MHNKMHNNILFLKYIFLFILSKFKKSEKYKKITLGVRIIKYKLITFSRANIRNYL